MKFLFIVLFAVLVSGYVFWPPSSSEAVSSPSLTTDPAASPTKPDTKTVASTPIQQLGSQPDHGEVAVEDPSMSLLPPEDGVQLDLEEETVSIDLGTNRLTISDPSTGEVLVDRIVSDNELFILQQQHSETLDIVEQVVDPSDAEYQAELQQIKQQQLLEGLSIERAGDEFKAIDAIPN